MAFVIEGNSGVGAFMFISKPASSAAFVVVVPNVAMRVLFCSKSGKFLNKLLGFPKNPGFGRTLLKKTIRKIGDFGILRTFFFVISSCTVEIDL